MFSFSLNLDDFRPFVAAFDMYARGNPTDNKPIDGHYALYIIVVAGKDLNKDHNNSRYGAIVKLSVVFEDILLPYIYIYIYI